ncbi:MAG: hypothetical protein WA113_01605 [Desulfitobacteriaceae bacterium]
MNQYYNQHYTKEQIEIILQTIQDCIRRNRYIISKNENRSENIEFINNYNLSTAKQKDILLRIEPDDFCHSLQNTNLGFEYETLYVFCTQIMLFNFDGEEELVDIYTKFNIIEYDAGKRVIAISFHKRNKPLDYLFR